MPDDSAALEQPLLRNRDFLLFVATRTGNVFGLQALTTAVLWHVYLMTGDPMDIGYIGLAQFAPALLLFLAAGIAADRIDRRIILGAGNAVHGAVTAALMLLLAGGNASMAAILSLLVVHGIARAFYHTASQAILPALVPAAQFPNAIAWSGSASKAAQLGGPAIAGVVIAYAGDAVYWVILAVFALSALTAFMIRNRHPMPTPERVTMTSIMAGFDYIWRTKIVLGAISIDLMAVLFGGVMAILTIYAQDILQVGADGLGLMRAMPGVGSLIVGLALAQLAAPRHMGIAMFAALGVFGLSIIVFSLSEIFWVSLIALAVYGGADMVSVYVRQTLTQIATPDAMRGRVSAVNSVSINASNELGDFRAGMMAAAIGVVPAVLAGGVITCGITLLWMRLFPGIAAIDRLRDVARPDDPK
jgi:MFS family permease